MEKSIIKIVNMSFKYNKEDYLFRNFNLDIKEGSFTTIIGKNGSGKSTLAKILIGLYKAEGYITIDGYLLNDFYIKKIRRIFSALGNYVVKLKRLKMGDFILDETLNEGEFKFLWFFFEDDLID